jgi:hypothetical protein
MNKTGMTQILIEELPRGSTQVSPAQSPAVVVQEAIPNPPPPPVQAQSTPAPGQQAREQSASPQQILPVQTITDIQYVAVPSPAPVSCAPSLLLAILLLLILVIILLVVILALLLRRLPLWPWYYPFWLRRYYRYAKKRGRAAGRRGGFLH